MEQQAFQAAGRQGTREDAVAGHGRLAMLVDEPGIGKTRTAQELAEYAEGQGVQVLWDRCLEAKVRLPTDLRYRHPDLLS